MKLKDCPFCGADDSEYNAIQEAGVYLRQVATPINKPGYEVQCKCGARGPRSLNPLEAEALWNRRPPQFLYTEDGEFNGNQQG